MGTLALQGGTPVRSGKQWPAWPVHDDREEELVLDVVRSGRWSFNGPRELEFARRFAAYQGAAYGECVANGTCALEIAYAALGVKPGDEVIVPALTWLATAMAAVTLGAVPVFVDVDPSTYQLDTRRIEEAITPRTKVIAPVHLYSGIVDMDAVLAVARRHGVAVVEDCAHAQGGRWRCADGALRATGSMGDFGAFSFQQSKSITAGEGGILLTSDLRLADLAYAYKNCGRRSKRRQQEAAGNSVLTFGGMGGSVPDSAAVMGWNSRLTEFQAAVLLAQLERFDAQANRREAAAHYLDQRLAAIPGIEPLYRDPRVARRSFYGYVFRYDPEPFGGLPAAHFRAALAAEGLPTGATYGPVWAHELWAVPPHRFRIASRDVADRVTNEAVAFQHPLLLGTDEDLDDIVAAVQKIYSHVGELRPSPTPTAVR